MSWLVWMILLAPVVSVLWALLFWVAWRISSEPVIIKRPPNRKGAKARKR